jgi:hypothetical protein
MMRSAGNGVSKRRPPAIEPVRKVLRIDSAGMKPARPPAERAKVEMPNVVLRLPEIRSESDTEPQHKPANQLPGTKDRLKIIGVAAALVLLAVLLFSSAEQPAKRPLDPLTPTPLAPAAASPDQQCAPPWQSPVVALPAVSEPSNATSIAEQPAYRTADRSAGSGDRYQQPSVRFEGSIEKQTPDIRHERP